jgi:hypothetical protein
MMPDLPEATRIELHLTVLEVIAMHIYLQPLKVQPLFEYRKTFPGLNWSIDSKNNISLCLFDDLDNVVENYKDMTNEVKDQLTKFYANNNLRNFFYQFWLQQNSMFY